MAQVYYQYEVFVAAGETVKGFWEIVDPRFTDLTPDNATLVVWEPVPYTSFLGVPDCEPLPPLPSVQSFTYNETQITITNGQFQFWKTITNASKDDNGQNVDFSFTFLVSFL